MYKGLEAMEQTDSFPQTPFYMFRWTRWPMRAQRKSCRFTWRVVGSLSRTTVEQSECLDGEDFGSSRLQWMLGWVRFGADFLPDWVLQCTTNHRRTGETGERGERGNVKQILTPFCLSVVCLPIQVSTNLVWTYLLQRDKLNWLQKVSLLRLDQSDKKSFVLLQHSFDYVTSGSSLQLSCPGDWPQLPAFLQRCVSPRRKLFLLQGRTRMSKRPLRSWNSVAAYNDSQAPTTAL